IFHGEKNMEEVLRIENLSKTYKKKNNEVLAVKDISFKGYKGEILGMLGPNGSGKTTTVKSIATIVEYDKGQIFVNGIDNKKHQNSVKQCIGAVLEGARNIYWRLTAKENLIYFAGLKGFGYKQIKDNLEYFLEKLELKDVANKQVREFSKGMQQKVAVACAFITSPKVVLLDEPTLGLDIETARNMQQWIKLIAKQQETFILITSHDMRFIENVCDRVLIIKEGSIIANDSVSDLKKYFMRKVYHILLEEDLLDEQKNNLEKGFRVRFEHTDKGHSIYLTLENDSYLYDIFEILGRKKQSIQSIEILNDDFEDVFLEILRRNGEKI
ncbi:MAG: ABC transporter ATP-binding protein, partial [Spirochaetes bacterium]|nr:ABC transporter ATP-binding protein [Spirochaetota bacterium]HOV46960.1 ABC transporter ATP-binding protein [Exilispira sp.]